MKNNNHSDIRQGRAHQTRAQAVSAAAVASVSQGSIPKFGQKPGRKRRTNYTKKIMNDPFIFTV